MKVKTDYQQKDEKPYITPGKEYEVEMVHDNERDMDFATIIGDNGRTCYIHIPRCCHLDFTPWEVID